jgi:replicative DNA helicase
MRPEHFAHPFHATVLAACDALHRKGMPVDEVFVKQSIDAKQWDEVAFLDILSANPVANPEAYMGDLIDKYRRRRVAELAAKMRELAETEDDIDDVIDLTTTTLGRLDADDGADHCKTFDEFKEHYEKVGKPPLYKTGVSFIDSTLSGGFQLGQLFFLSGAKESGKAQPVDEPVMTPDGWRPIGNLKVGDFVIGSDGKPVRVLGVFPQGVKPCWRVEINDGSCTRCCDEHLWTVQTPEDRQSGRARTLTLREMMGDYHKVTKSGNAYKYALPQLAPCEFTEKSLPLHPYLMGFLLGDGCFRAGSVTFSNGNEEIVRHIIGLLPEEDEAVRINQNDWRVRRKVRTKEAAKTMQVLRELHLYGAHSDEKFVPAIYMLGSVEQRKELLWGLLDTDGHISADRTGCEYVTTSRVMADDVAELVRSFGGRASIRERIPQYGYKGEKRDGKKAYRLHITLPDGIGHGKLHPNLSVHKQKRHPIAKTITKIERQEACEMVCIMVDAPDHLYVTGDYILTHNTFILTKILENVSKGHKVGFFSMEFGSRMYIENMTKKHGQRYRNENIYINDTLFDIAEVEREIRYQHKHNGVKFWGIDSQLRLTNKMMNGSTREIWLGDIFSRLARLAVTLDILIMIIVQVSKEGYKSDEPTVKGCVDADHEATTWLHLTKIKGEGERRSALWVKNKQTYKHPKHILDFDPVNHTFKEVKEKDVMEMDGTTVVVEYQG